MNLPFRKIAKRLGCSDTADLFTPESVIGVYKGLIVDVERRFFQVPFQKPGKSSNTLSETVESCPVIFDGLLDDIASDLLEPVFLFLLFDLCKLPADSAFLYDP